MASQSLGLKRVQKSLVSPKSSNHLERSNITTGHLACLHKLAVLHGQFSLFILFLPFPSPCLILSLYGSQGGLNIMVGLLRIRSRAKLEHIQVLLSHLRGRGIKVWKIFPDRGNVFYSLIPHTLANITSQSLDYELESTSPPCYMTWASAICKYWSSIINFTTSERRAAFKRTHNEPKDSPLEIQETN